MRKIALVTVAAGALVLPAGAHASAKSKTVYLGPPPAKSSPTGDLPIDVDADFPSSIKIKAGGKIHFAPQGFHNVEIPATGQDPAPLFTPTGTAVSEKDAAGNDFWFNGQPMLGFNPAVGAASGFSGKTVTFKASKGVESGLPTQAKPKPFTVKFPKAGTYTYVCVVHPGMQGTIRVVGKSHKVPSAKADKKTVKKQVAAAVKIANELAQKTSTGNDVSIGESGAHGVELFAFVPDSLTVPVGTTVNFHMPTGSLEDHTATAGPGDPGGTDMTTYLATLAGSFNGPAPDPAAVYPSDPPPNAASLTSTSHGNGFWNSGVLDDQAATPLASANSVKFTQAGTFTFYCLIHPFMKATVTVQ